MIRPAWVIGAAILAGCAPAEEPQDLGTCDASSGRMHWLVTDLRWGRVEDGVSDGFDLDGDGGTAGCGGADFVAPDGREGIDNALGSLLPILELTEFSAAESIIAELIRTGEIGLIGELTGLDDATDDDCVGLALRGSLGAPMLGTDGDPLAWQTLDLDPGFVDQVFEEVSLVDGAVEGGPLTATLPVSFLGADLELVLYDGAMRMDLQADGTSTGIVAGGLDVDYVVQEIQNNGVADELKELADSALRISADLAADDTGVCTQLSVVLVFDATPVFVYDDVWR